MTRPQREHDLARSVPAIDTSGAGRGDGGKHCDRLGVVAPLLLLLLLLVGGPIGCGDPLEVSDPTAVLDDELNDAVGAELLRRGALKKLYEAAAESAWFSGLLADEFRVQQTTFWDLLGSSSGDELLDRRNTMESEQKGGLVSYGNWQWLRMRSLPAAVAKLRAYAPPGAREAHVGEMFALHGFAATRLAEDFCPGFPLHTVVDYKISYGPPLSTEQVFERALAAFDSAVTWAADSARVLNFARVGRARALLNLGRFAEAAAAVTDVPTGYGYQTEYNSTTDPQQPNILGRDWPGWATEGADGRRSMADREGENGLDFVAAQDPRVKADSLGMARDGVTKLYGIGKYPNRGAPIVLANGIEARLIAAEAELRANPDQLQWLTILNDLRAPSGPNSGGVSGLVPLTDPGTAAGRLELVFRERAFWLFATGHRLGDLRRLIRVYNRPSENVFPTGPYWRGGVYSTGTSLPFYKDEVTYSPGVTGCTSR